jgi:hypothetical protein
MNIAWHLSHELAGSQQAGGSAGWPSDQRGRTAKLALGASTDGSTCHLQLQVLPRTLTRHMLLSQTCSSGCRDFRCARGVLKTDRRVVCRRRLGAPGRLRSRDLGHYSPACVLAGFGAAAIWNDRYQHNCQSRAGVVPTRAWRRSGRNAEARPLAYGWNITEAGAILLISTVQIVREPSISKVLARPSCACACTLVQVVPKIPNTLRWHLLTSRASVPCLLSDSSNPDGIVCCEVALERQLVLLLTCQVPPGHLSTCAWPDHHYLASL